MKDGNISDRYPYLVEAFFDGEIDPIELSEDELRKIEGDPALGGLAELRGVVKADADLAISSIDDASMLEVIHRGLDKIDLERSKSSVSEPVRTSRRSVGRHVLRWFPAAVGVCLFLISIPGLYNMMTGPKEKQEQTVPTVVYIDSNMNNHAQEVANCPSQPLWHEPNNVPSIEGNDEIKSSEDQLTVEEMDRAIRYLIHRLESLEDSKRQGVEKGDVSLQNSFPDAPIYKL